MKKNNNLKIVNQDCILIPAVVFTVAVVEYKVVVMCALFEQGSCPTADQHWPLSHWQHEIDSQVIWAYPWPSQTSSPLPTM